MIDLEDYMYKIVFVQCINIFKIYIFFVLKYLRTSLVRQWIEIHLPTQGTWVQSLVWEDSTYPEATKPMCHKYRV